MESNFLCRRFACFCGRGELVSVHVSRTRVKKGKTKKGEGKTSRRRVKSLRPGTK